MGGESIRVNGIVQGVGFRPTVWRLARECGLSGSVCNDAEGVLIQAWGDEPSLDAFVARLQAEPPPLARIEGIVRSTLIGAVAPAGFSIVASQQGEARTGVAADAAVCPACLAEVMDPDDRRYRYPFTNCTHCGPRLSIVSAIPYDRANTSMAAFPMCERCRVEYEDPNDRRYHAQPNACPDCGPQVWLEDNQGARLPTDDSCDALEQAARLIRAGYIVAVKGIGGFHLACDAGDETVVAKLRSRKRRYHKALALMARDLEMIERYAPVDETEAILLQDRAASIVVLQAGGERLAESVAPGQNGLGFMLPYTPLHHLLMLNMRRPIVLTSGNLSEEPQTINNAEARQRLSGIADYFLLHDRAILNRLDDSVLRVAAGAPRFLRRARGYAPQSLCLPAGFEQADAVLAMGGELKNSFCLLRQGRAVLSQHMGDLEDAATLKDYQHNLRLYRQLFDFEPRLIAVDRHPDYFSTQSGQRMAAEAGLELVAVQHHHAHIAACMAEQGLPLDAGKVLGVALDGLGFGAGGGIWGGEFLLADYRGFERLAHFQPMPMPGGAQAMREPWRNTLAYLCGLFDWQQIAQEYADLEIIRYLQSKPLGNLRTMLDKGLNSPPASSAGRLFDAVAAAVGVCRESAGYEGQAAIELEALAEPYFEQQADNAYDCEFNQGVLNWKPLWRSLLRDLQAKVEAGVIAARFHQGVAQAVANTAHDLCEHNGLQTVILSGGVFQNRLLLERTSDLLQQRDLQVLSPVATPANDGGISLGQAVIAYAAVRV